MFTFKDYLAEVKVRDSTLYSHDDVQSYLNKFSPNVIEHGVEIKTNIPGVVLHVERWTQREYIVVVTEAATPVGYVEFLVPERLALGKQEKVFSEVVRTPHAGVLRNAAGKKYAMSVYSWFLNDGNILITGKEQTPASNSMWQKLSAEFKLHFINSSGDEIVDPTPEQAQRLSTRMVLIGTGRSLKDLFK